MQLRTLKSRRSTQPVSKRSPPTHSSCLPLSLPPSLPPPPPPPTFSTKKSRGRGRDLLGRHPEGGELVGVGEGVEEHWETGGGGRESGGQGRDKGHRGKEDKAGCPGAEARVTWEAKTFPHRASMFLPHLWREERGGEDGSRQPWDHTKTEIQRPHEDSPAVSTLRIPTSPSRTTGVRAGSLAASIS